MREDVPGRVWSATVLSALARQWGALCTFLSLVLVARALPPAEFGRFTFWIVALSFLEVLSDFGTSSAAVQRGASDARVFSAALAAARRVRALVAGLGIALCGLAAGAWGEHSLPWVLAALLGPLARVPEASAIVFQREIAWGRPLVLRALGAAVRLAAIAALSRIPGLGFGPFLLAHAGTLALGNVALHFVARPHLPPREPPLHGFLASALPLALAGLAQQATLHADTLFVRALSGPAELGRYHAAVRVFLWLAAFAAFATQAALPWLARRHAAGGLGEAAARLVRPLYLAACGAAGLLAPWSAAALRLAFGPGFESAGASLRWLLVALVPVALGSVLLTSLIAAGGARASLGVASLALLVALAGNALFVPSLGAEGAALTKLASEGTVALASLLVLRHGGIRPPLSSVFLLLGLALLVGSAVASRALHALLLPA